LPFGGRNERKIANLPQEAATELES